MLYNNQINACALIGQSVPVNPRKNRASSELLYTRRIRKPLAHGSWFTNSSRVLPTSRVVYQLLYNNQINVRALFGQSAVGYCAGKPTENPVSSNYYIKATDHKFLWVIG